MKVSIGTMNVLQSLLIGLAVVFCIVFLPTLVFLIVGNQVAAAITGTVTVGILLAFTHTLALALGTWYTRGTMQMGAELVTKAQETNDRWDERKTAAFGRIMVEGARIGRSSSASDQPLFPLPSQDPSWLPQVAMLPSHDSEDGWNNE